MALECTDHVISDRLRTSVWNELYENERVSRYYQELLKRHKRLDVCLRLSTAMGAVTVSFLRFTDDNLLWLNGFFVLVFLSLYALESVVSYVKVNPLTQARKGCSTVQSMLEELWRDIESHSVTDSVVKFRLSQILKNRDVLVTDHIIRSQLTENRDLNVKCAKEAKENMINMYEGASA